MKIEAEKYYERRDGIVAKAMRSTVCHGCDLRIGDAYYDSSRGGGHKMLSCDIIAEVQIVLVLGFPLVAGERYETVKPDGTAGPIVELVANRFAKAIAPFYCIANVAEHWVGVDGAICRYSGEGSYQIVRPYIEPKPPTLSQRILQLRSQCLGRADLAELHAEFESLATDVFKLESKP